MSTLSVVACLALGAPAAAQSNAPAELVDPTPQESARDWSTLDEEVRALVEAILAERQAREPAATAADAEAETIHQEEWRVYWKDALTIEGPDTTIKIGGRTMIDFAGFSGDDFEDATGISLDDGAEFRRARLYVLGTIYGNIDFKAQYEFATGIGDTAFADVYIRFQDLYGLQVGHFKEPFGLEQLTSSRFTTFMERTLGSDALTPVRNMGMAIMHPFSDAQQGTWSVGLFRDTNSFGTDLGDGELALTGRVTYLPYSDADDSHLVHVGAAFSQRDADDDEERFVTRPGAHLLDPFVNTGLFPANSTTQYGLEAAWVHGPFSLQGEYFAASTDTDSGDADQSAYYLQASYFLTGEHRTYKRSSAAFGRVTPTAKFAKGQGGGAWELGLRVSHLELEDTAFFSDEQDNVTLGLNWHLNRGTRIMWNYTRADLDSVDEQVDMLMMRFQIEF
ncbi:MAG: porin [Planctomycetota bacterium]